MVVAVKMVVRVLMITAGICFSAFASLLIAEELTLSHFQAGAFP